MWGWAIIAAGTVAAVGFLAVAAARPVPPSLAAPEAYTIETTERERMTATVIGDSYSTGTGSVREAGGYVDEVKRRMCWAVTLNAEGGTGYTNSGPPGDGKQTYPQRAGVVSSSDVVLVQGSLNDIGATTTELAAAVNATLDTVAKRSPSARVVLIGPANTPRYGTQTERVRDVLSQVASRRDIEFIDPIAGRWLGRGSFAADGVHPSQDGHDAFAAQLISQLRALGLSGC